MEDKVFNDMMKIYLAQTNSALKISKIICEHSDREELSGNDIICGLIYRLMNPMDQSEIDENLNTADELLNEEDEEDYDEEDYDEIEEVYEKPNISKQIKSNNCNCDVCMKMRVDLINYKTFESRDQLSELFKRSIDTTCDKYNIII